MYIKRAEIQNFKGIETMILEFSSGVNLLIGNNGVGKTAVLEALALSIQPYFHRMNDVIKKGIAKNDVRFVSNLRRLRRASIRCLKQYRREEAIDPVT